MQTYLCFFVQVSIGKSSPIVHSDHLDVDEYKKQTSWKTNCIIEMTSLNIFSI